MRRIVLDTSALVRFYVPDGPMPAGLEAAVQSAWRSECVLLMPELALAEVGEVLRKKERARRLSAAEAGEILDAVLRLPIEYEGHRECVLDAAALARRERLTVYDALFVVLALRHSADLITADGLLAKAWRRCVRQRG